MMVTSVEETCSNRPNRRQSKITRPVGGQDPGQNRYHGQNSGSTCSCMLMRYSLFMILCWLLFTEAGTVVQAYTTFTETVSSNGFFRKQNDGSLLSLSSSLSSGRLYPSHRSFPVRPVSSLWARASSSGTFASDNGAISMIDDPSLIQVKSDGDRAGRNRGSSFNSRRRRKGRFSNQTATTLKYGATRELPRFQTNKKINKSHAKRREKVQGATSPGKVVIFFNKKLSTILRKGRYSQQSVQQVDLLLWQRVEPYFQPGGNATNQPRRNNNSLRNSLGVQKKTHAKVLPFDAVSFNIVMLGWSRQASWYAAEQAYSWLRRLWQMSPLLQADSYSYAAVLNAYAKTRTIKGAVAAQELLQLLISGNGSRLLTTDSLHNVVMDAWAGSGHPESGSRAYALLQQLQRHPNVQPSHISYNTCIKAFANTPGQIWQAQKILEEMKNSSSIQPNSVSYTTCIQGWSNTMKREEQKCSSDSTIRIKGATEIRRLLDEMESRYIETNDEQIRPDLFTYTSVLSAQAVNPLELLSRMNKIGNQQQLPNAAFLNTCIHLLSQALERKSSGRENVGMGQENDAALEATTTAQVAETLLRQMQQQQYPSMKQMVSLTHTPNVETKACKVTYTSVIAVWAQCGTVSAALRAESLLDELQEMWEVTRDQDYLPSAKSFCSVLTAWIRVASSESQLEELKRQRNESFSILDHAIELQQRMHRLYERTKFPELAPNCIIFVQIFQLMASARDPSGANRAQQILKQMDDYAKQGHVQVRPDSTILATFLNAATKTGVGNIVDLATCILVQVEEGYENGMGHLKPSSLFYSAVLQAYAKSASRQGAMLAQNLLDRTKSLYQGGKLYAKPTVLSYNAVIDAYARSNSGLEAAEQAEKLLMEMMRKSSAGDRSMRPNTRSFNAAILAWKNAREFDGPQRAERLLKIMTERCEAGDKGCRPDHVTFNSVVGTWAKSSHKDAPERAMNLLLFMEEKTKNGEKSLQPDRITFNSCVDAFARRGAAKEASDIVMRMLYCDTQPDHITLKSLRTAWERSGDPNACLELQRIERLVNEAKRKHVP